MKKQFLLLIIFAVTQSFIAQHKYDIGISFSDQSVGFANYGNKFSLEFRRKHSDKWMFTNNIFFGYNKQLTRTSPMVNFSNDYIYGINDSSITVRHENVMYKNQINGSFGFERSILKSFKNKPIENPLFSYSIDLILGLSKAFKENYNTTYYFDSSTFSNVLSDIYSNNFRNSSLSSNFDFYEANFIHTGFQIQLKANIPINEKLILFLSYRRSLTLNLTLNESYGNPIYNSTNISLNDITPFPNTFDANNNILIGLRYKFGKESSPKSIEPKKN
tara:strand:+ start:94 stop:918 length:825 start_codon:yes stop_codon:yes gene_type:complete